MNHLAIERIRDLAAMPGEVGYVAAELLAARETIAAQLAAGKALYEAVQKLMAERDAARAELAEIRGRDAKPFDWDGVPTVEEWIEESLREREPRAGSAMVEIHPDEVVADRGEARRVAGWLKDLLAELAEARRQRDELLEAAKLAIREIRPSTDCSMCHDSTWGHECDSKVSTTHVALSNAIKGAIAAEQPKRDWPEDAADTDNGSYQCRCVTCGESFTGYKRRVVCKACAEQPKPAGGAP